MRETGWGPQAQPNLRTQERPVTGLFYSVWLEVQSPLPTTQ